MDRLTDAEIQGGIEGRDWRRVGDAIVAVRTFVDFAGAFAFVTGVAALAEERNHHPDIAISWNEVTLTLSTHSAGGLTGLDLELAAAIDGLEGRP